MKDKEIEYIVEDDDDGDDDGDDDNDGNNDDVVDEGKPKYVKK